MDNVELQVAVLTLEVLMKYGIPAAANILTTLSAKEKITLEDIRALRGELDSASYFEK